jgi:hypothetical protein
VGSAPMEGAGKHRDHGTAVTSVTTFPQLSSASLQPRREVIVMHRQEASTRASSASRANCEIVLPSRAASLAAFSRTEGATRNAI